MPPTLTPGAWLELLEHRLDTRWQRLGLFDAYYNGDHRLAFATGKWREAFGNLFGEIADNWCQIVVDSSVERLKVQGFRFGAEQAADTDAWAIWQANGLDAESDMAHTEAVKLSEAYWLVEPPARGSDNPPRITAEHPSQMIVATAPGNRRVRLAALKKWVDDDGFAYATLYFPEGLVKYRSESKLTAGGVTGGQINWVRRPGDPGGRNALGEVPVVPLRNNPSMLGGGRSDLETVLPLQDSANKLLSDMLIASEYLAFQQRVLTGVEVPKDPNTGRPLKSAQLEAAMSRLWVFENENAKVQEFSAAELKNYTDAIAMIVRHLCAQTRTPPHYVLGEIVNASGDALKAAETGLVAKVQDKMVTFGEGHEDAMRLAFKALGDTAKAAVVDSETIWRDPESRSFGELVDGLVKLATIGIPQEVLWERGGFSPQEIARMKTMQAIDALFAPIVPAQPTQQPSPNGIGQNAGV